MSYIPLWNKSNFSFLEGASHPEELVEQAWLQGLPAVAITDRDGIYGVVEAHMKATELGVHLLIGSEITLTDQSTITLLAMDRAGYGNLCRLISKGRLRNPKGSCSVLPEEVAEHAPGLIALWGGRESALAAPGDPSELVGTFCEAFDDRLYALVDRHREAEEIRREGRLRDRVRRAGIPTVAATEVLYHTPARRPLQDVLTCIRNGTHLGAAGRLIRANSHHDLKSPVAFQQLFEDDPVSVDRTRHLAGRCRFSLSELRYVYPSESLPDGMESIDWLHKLALEGARKRYGEIPRAVENQISKELALIEELDYCGYFLTMWEIVEFCRQHGILCQGRGSAANSAVCYCLGITAVDPNRFDLLFERFLSRERAEPPDIDLDIMHERREEVIQWVYEKYGRDRAALAATFVRYRSRSALREVGKALGLPLTSVDRLARLTSYYELDADTMRRAGFDPENPVHGHLLRLSEEIREFPRHLSIHPGGFLLGHEPVHSIVPIENASMEDRTVIQWNKDSLEDLNLFKVDLLGLGALTQLDKGFAMMREHYDVDLSMDELPEGDEKTYDMICESDTVGVFQIESRAQMAMLPRLRPRTYYDLVIEVSIVRPGPITGGMVHPYLRRRSGEEAVIYPHECLEPVLKKTLGVPLFQEQVMKLAMVAADYTPGEADQLRRDMAAWRKSGRIERHRERLVRRMTAKGISPEFAERVFDQIRGFGEYGFPESHAASFALIAYATSWMKCHYPDVFCCSILNAQPMGFYAPSTLIEDARRHGVEVRPVDVRISDWACTLEPRDDASDFAVRMGMSYVKGFSHERDWLSLEAARRERPFTTAEDFVRRTQLNEGILRRLAESGALAGLEGSRRQALWSVQGVSRVRSEELELALEEEKPLFTDLSSLESINWDYETKYHSTEGHPLEPLREALTKMRLPDAETVRGMSDGRRVKYAGMVICRQRPGTAGGVTFMTLEDETGFVNVILWKKVYQEHRILARTARFLGVSGTLQAKDGVTHLVADRLWVPELSAPKSAKSRDFH